MQPEKSAVRSQTLKNYTNSWILCFWLQVSQAVLQYFAKGAFSCSLTFSSPSRMTPALQMQASLRNSLHQRGSVYTACILFLCFDFLFTSSTDSHKPLDLFLRDVAFTWPTYSIILITATLFLPPCVSTTILYPWYPTAATAPQLHSNESMCAAHMF